MTARPWDADVDLPETDATALIERQFPALAPARLALLGAGWDNTAWMVNDRLVFRFPRRTIAVELLETELRYLPTLAPGMPLAMPVPEWRGQVEPGGAYPYPFAGYRMLPGVTACRAGGLAPDAATAVENGRRLGRFLARLHAAPTDPQAPGDRFRRGDLHYRLESMTSLLERLCTAGQLPADDITAIRERLQALVNTPPVEPGNERWCHGDLYARHVLVGNGSLVTGVIDWGDVHVGDPAIDLSIAYSALPPAAREALFGEYSGDDSALRDRARFRALCYGPLLIDYGVSIRDAALETAGRTAIRHALAE